MPPVFVNCPITVIEQYDPVLVFIVPPLIVKLPMVIIPEVQRIEPPLTFALPLILMEFVTSEPPFITKSVVIILESASSLGDILPLFIISVPSVNIPHSSSS